MHYRSIAWGIRKTPGSDIHANLTYSEEQLGCFFVNERWYTLSSTLPSRIHRVNRIAEDYVSRNIKYKKVVSTKCQGIKYIKTICAMQYSQVGR